VSGEWNACQFSRNRRK